MTTTATNSHLLDRHVCLDVERMHRIYLNEYVPAPQVARWSSG